MSLEHSIMTESKEALQGYKDMLKRIRGQPEEAPSGQIRGNLSINKNNNWNEFKCSKYDTHTYIFVCVNIFTFSVSTHPREKPYQCKR